MVKIIQINVIIEPFDSGASIISKYGEWLNARKNN